MLDRKGKQAAYPFFFEERVERFRGNKGRGVDGSGPEFFFCAGKVERDVLDVSTAFLPAGGFLFIHCKAVHAQAEIGAEPAPFGIKATEEFPLEQFGEEALG